MTDSILYTEDIREAMTDSYLDCCLHLVVLQGEASFRLEGKQYHVKENDCIIKPGASPITDVWASDDLRMKGLIITNEYLRKVVPKTHYQIKDSSGHNASYWIDHFTSLKIARLLQHENLTLKDITYKFCFSSVNYFTRYVKRTLGMTPSDYRARHKAKE